MVKQHADVLSKQIMPTACTKEIETNFGIVQNTA